ncbi:MAG: hypothetical protein ABW215_19570 [Kibdelosporangium sp.]
MPGSTTGTGPQTLKVDPPAIPGARDAFLAAADEIDALVAQLNGMNTPAWAGDPVSQQTAERFETGAGDRGTQPAIAALRKYGDELRASGVALQNAYTAYVQNEGANTERWRGQPGLDD